MTSNSFSCYRAVRADRRANDLTVEALLRDVTLSASTTLSSVFAAAVGWYVAHDRRQQRRRHHYRRAMHAISDRRLAAKVTASTSSIVATPKLANASFIHFAGSESGALPNAVMFAPNKAIPALPPPHVCAEANRREPCLAAS